jgi:hypothetical protein
MRAHAAAWGDANADGLVDLFVGTFGSARPSIYEERGAQGPSPDRLLLNGEGSFQADQQFPSGLARTSGAVFADLDMDGDLELVLSRNASQGAGDQGSNILQAQGGTFQPVKDSGIDPGLGGRSVGVLDYDQDGLPDLFIAEDRWSGGSSLLLHNQGELRFIDATGEAGLPQDVHGLGVGTADLNDDGHTDLFVAGSNRLFLSNGDGTFREISGDTFRWETFGPEDDVSGVASGDLNRDGWPDIVLGHHYNSTVDRGQQVPIRLYIHRGLDARGDPIFEDVSEQSGLPPLPTKAPHVEINDFDNDGNPDILATASAAGGTLPAVFRNLGSEGGIPRFEVPQGIGQAQYWVTGPTADFDQDGRVDIFLVEWDPALPSRLLRNVSHGGNWLSVEIGPDLGGGVGGTVAVYEGGWLGEPDFLLGVQQISLTSGYSAGHQAIAHFGLGEVQTADVEVQVPGRLFELTSVPANRHLRLPEGCDGA